MKTEKEILYNLHKANDDIVEYRNMLIELVNPTKSNIEALNKLIEIDQIKINVLMWVLEL